MPKNNEAAAATIARVLEQISSVRPVAIEYEDGEDGGTLVRVVIERDVSELLCTMNSDGDLIAARLIEH